VLKTLITGYYSHDLPDLALVQNADIHVLENLKILENYPTTFYNSKKILHEFSSPDHSVRKSLPFQRRIPIWFYNQEWLFKLNLEHEKIPQNFEKLISFWKKIKSKQDKKMRQKIFFLPSSRSKVTQPSPDGAR
jgi:ABC-type glycerol-3-phosphate transport system substrate-binding protein